MIGSLYAGISGLNANASAMSVIGDNIANVNTTAFKSNSASFVSVLSQSLTCSTGNTIGRGVQLGGVSESWSQGTLETTSNATDLAINGKGFFMVKDQAGLTYYTRAGGFNFDLDGNLVNTNGLVVQGYEVKTVNADGTFTLAGTVSDISVTGVISPPKTTDEISTSLNLDAGAIENDEYSTTMTVYDSLGNDIPLTITFTRNAGVCSWDVKASMPDSISGGTDPTITVGATTITTLEFDVDGKLAQLNGAAPTAKPEITLTLDNGAQGTQVITWELFNDDLSSNDTVTGYASPSITSFQRQNGYAAGTLQGISVDERGVVTGAFTNGELPALFQISLADFPNYQGLDAIGDSLYAQSRASGQSTPGIPGNGKLGLIAPNSLEMSNVDLATEFVKMITTQRAFQASSRVITTSDEILQELINLKR
jgi:flagellar hook protein FlgE